MLHRKHSRTGGIKMRKRQKGLILICARTDEELSSLAWSALNLELELALDIIIISKRDRFTEQDLNQVEAKNNVNIYHFFLDDLDTKGTSRLIFEAFRLSPRIIYFDNFDYGTMINPVISVAESSHLIILGLKNQSPSEAIEQLTAKICKPHRFKDALNKVIAPSYEDV